MRAMVLERQAPPAARRRGEEPLRWQDVPVPDPAAGQLRVRVEACAVCRTDLHVIDGELPQAKLPLIPGHEIVGLVDCLGPGTAGPAPGTRVGIPWLGFTCGTCPQCRAGRENLCAEARFTGYHLDGGYAEYAVADARYCFPIPPGYPPRQAAPLLCAGLIGYRAWRFAGDALSLGFYGFGAAAHILAQVAVAQGRRIYAFTRPGDRAGQTFARELGACWAGGSDQPPPELLDAAILFAPAGALVPLALRAVRPGGTVVCAGIHMSDIPSFPYADLWQERALRSVANLTRADAAEFLRLAPEVPVRTRVTPFPLHQANEAIDAVRQGALDGAAVLAVTD